MDHVESPPYADIETGLTDRGELFGKEDYSLDPMAGGTYLDKTIYDVGQIIANLNRTGNDWYTDNYGELDDGVLNFGFWKNIEELQNSYYVSDDGSISFNEAFYSEDFSAFSVDQQNVARKSLTLWNDLVDITFQETRSGVADITFGNTDTGGAQAYAYLPFGSGEDQFYTDYYGFSETGRLGGDVWIDGFVPSNFNPLTDGYYATTTMIHELGHALGLSHPGDYNATDDNDGDGIPDPITYANDAYFAQDSRQYSIMSYFDAYETGAQHIDWSLDNFAYAATPLIHDIATIQSIYGADMSTRTGDTVYGFNSTAGRSAYDFTVNTRPIVAIWDAGGKDTIDFSGWDTPSIIDLNAGGFSSGGGIEEFLTLEQVNANRAALGFAPRSQETFDFYEDLKAQLGLTSGLYKDNISIAYGATIENAIGGGGNDLLIGNNVANVLNGGGGLDVASYQFATAAVTASLLTGGSVGAAQGDTYISMEGLTGSQFGDRLYGDAGKNLFEGLGGADTFDGKGGIDTATYAHSTAAVAVSLLNGGTGDAAGDRFFNIENLTGSNFDDTLGGNGLTNVIDGGTGVDTLFYGASARVALNLATGGTYGYAKGDTYQNIENVKGSDLDDNITGNSLNNVIDGGKNNDTLNGAGGNDTIDGGAGWNKLTGGAGADTFAFTVLDGGKDIVTDFAKGIDKIDVSGIDAIFGTPAHDMFTFVGSAAFTAAGQLHTWFDKGVLTLSGDTNGDGVADLVIALNGASSISATDILFA